MKSVNYFVLGEIFGLLERIELIDKIEFSRLDPDNENDVQLITEKYITPAFRDVSDANRETLRLSIGYYTTVDTAPIQLMKDRCQELTLPDADSWTLFFNCIGELLFGSDFRLGFDPGSVTERLNEQESETLFDIPR